MKKAIITFMLGMMLVYGNICHCGAGGYFTGDIRVVGIRIVHVYKCFGFGHYYYVDAGYDYSKDDDCYDDYDYDMGPYQ